MDKGKDTICAGTFLVTSAESRVYHIVRKGTEKALCGVGVLWGYNARILNVPPKNTHLCGSCRVIMYKNDWS